MGGAASAVWPANQLRLALSPVATSPGRLDMTYYLNSTTGNRAHLNTCSLFETLSLSQGNWPSPPWQAGQNYNGDHLMGSVATNGYADDAMVPGILQSPYGNGIVTGTQVWSYICTCYDPEHKYPIGGPYDLNRVVSPTGGG